jgi:predicted flap endonuclease-1-like 5' DNA nuclease
MPYTLAKALVWLVLAGVLGLIIGWLLRSVTATRQLSRARGRHADGEETQRLRTRVAELEAAVADRERLAADRDRLQHELDAAGRSAPADAVETETPSGVPADEDAGLSSAEAVLGRPIVRDDLKVVEGIGPSIEDLCHGIGIRTWSDLAETEPSLLRTMLDDAGPRSKTQNPDTWPRQAALLAAGDWQAFREFVDGLRDGVTSP